VFFPYSSWRLSPRCKWFCEKDANDFQWSVNLVWKLELVILCLFVSSDTESFLVPYRYLWHFSMLRCLIDHILNWCKALLYICLEHTESLNAVLYFRKKSRKWQVELPTGNRQRYMMGKSCIQLKQNSLFPSLSRWKVSFDCLIRCSINFQYKGFSI